MSLDERVSDLIKRIYCAGSDEAAWAAVSNDVIRQIGALRCFTTVVDLENREYSAWRFYGPEDTGAAIAMAEGPEIHELDPSLAWASANPNARFCDSSRTLPKDEYLSHPYVKWSADRLGVTHWYVGYTPAEDDLSYSFSVLFPATQGPGDPQKIRLFRMLFDHLDCATRLQRQQFSLQSARALMLLDRSGNVRQLSIGAEELLNKPDGITLSEGKLKLAASKEQASLDVAMARAASTLETGHPVAAIKASRPSGKRPWILTLRPLVHNFGQFGMVSSGVVLEIQDGSPKVGPLELLQSLYGLTDRELQVVRLLADRHSVESLANELRISPHTARTHLRAIFSKTGTGRQSELMQLCAGQPFG